MPHKILHLIDSAGLYGAETVILNLSRAMTDSPFVPVIGVLTDRHGTPKDIGKAAQELGMEVIYIPLKGRYSPSSLLRVYSCLKSYRIDVVHSHGYKATILAFFPSRVLHIPLMVTCHRWPKGGLKLKLYHRLEAAVMRFLPVVVGVSEPVCCELMATGINPKKVRLIQNGIDAENYRQYPREETARFLRRLGIGSEDFVVGTIGRLDAEKAHHHLIAAVKTLKDKGVDIQCIIVGEGDLRKSLEEQIQSLGLQDRVHLPGYRDDVLNILEHLDVFVLTSVNEGLPMVLLEAMAKGRPVIATPVGAIKDAIKHKENGLLFDVGDVAALVEAVRWLRHDLAFAEGLGRAARQTVEREFSSRVMARRYIEVYEHLAQTPPLANSR